MNTENNKRYDIKKIRTFLIEKRFGFCHAWWGIPAPNPAMNEYDKLEVVYFNTSTHLLFSFIEKILA